MWRESMKEPVVIRQISGNKRKRAKKQAMLLDMKSSHNMFSHVFSALYRKELSDLQDWHSYWLGFCGLRIPIATLFDRPPDAILDQDGESKCPCGTH
jgi:hypothetical protein